jgi:hypothetical protein
MSSENTKYQVLSCVLPYLENRTQARFRAVSKTIHNQVPESISKPPYAQIIEKHASTSISLDGGMLVTSASYTDPSGYLMHAKFLTLGHEHGKITVGVTHGLFYHNHCTIVKCKPNKIKKTLYHEIEKKKQYVKLGGTIENALMLLASEHSKNEYFPGK